MITLPLGSPHKHLAEWSRRKCDFRWDPILTLSDFDRDGQFRSSDIHPLGFVAACSILRFVFSVDLDDRDLKLARLHEQSQLNGRPCRWERRLPP